MRITLKNGNISDISQEEKQAYIDYVRQKYPDEIIDEIILEFDDEGYVNIETHKHSIPFNRIRRITGYLVSTLDKWNNAKKHEEADRVKHGISDINGVTE